MASQHYRTRAGVKWKDYAFRKWGSAPELAPEHLDWMLEMERLDLEGTFAGFLDSTSMWDRLTSALRGAVAALDRSGMRRVDVWRTLQCVADRYREGKPLDARLAMLSVLDKGLTAKFGQESARSLLVACNVINGSKANYARQLVRKELSSARARARPAAPLPPEVLGPDAYEEAWRRCNGHTSYSSEQSNAAAQALAEEERAVRAYERKHHRRTKPKKARVTAPR